MLQPTAAFYRCVYPQADSLLHSFFKTLVDHEVTVELKNDISIKGTLKSVDQFLNIKLDDIQVLEELKYPHLVSHKDNALKGLWMRAQHGVYKMAWISLG